LIEHSNLLYSCINTVILYAPTKVKIVTFPFPRINTHEASPRVSPPSSPVQVLTGLLYFISGLKVRYQKIHKVLACMWHFFRVTEQLRRPLFFSRSERYNGSFQSKGSPLYRKSRNVYIKHP
jgi:hypothetical protein